MVFVIIYGKVIFSLSLIVCSKFFYVYISDTFESIFSGPVQGKEMFKSFNFFFCVWGGRNRGHQWESNFYLVSLVILKSSSPLKRSICG